MVKQDLRTKTVGPTKKTNIFYKTRDQFGGLYPYRLLKLNIDDVDQMFKIKRFKNDYKNLKNDLSETNWDFLKPNVVNDETSEKMMNDFTMYYTELIENNTRYKKKY